jgi:hypothetical protein
MLNVVDDVDRYFIFPFAPINLTESKVVCLALFISTADTS